MMVVMSAVMMDAMMVDVKVEKMVSKLAAAMV